MILCVGTTPAVQRSMTFASLGIDEVNRAVEVTESAAGKGLNVSRVLTTLGVESLTTGFLGGATGEFVRAELDREGIGHRFVEVPFRTRTCVTVIDKAAGTTTELVEEAHPVAEEKWRELEALIEGYLSRCKMLVLSGNLSPTAPQDFYATCGRMAQSFGVPVVLDTRGAPLKLAMKYRPAMVKPNRQELGTTFGDAVETDDQLKDATGKLMELGAKSALITMGGRGAALSDGREFWFIPAPKVPVVNPIGSGDSVTAGVVAGMMRGEPLIECAKLGIACGAANAMTETPAVVHLADVERLRREVEVRPF